MRLSPPHYIDGNPESLEVSVLYVHEIDTPPGVEPVAWLLTPPEPVATVEQIRAVLEVYRTRFPAQRLPGVTSFRRARLGRGLENC